MKVICPTCDGVGGTSGTIPYAVARWRTPCPDCKGLGLVEAPEIEGQESLDL